MYEKQETPQQEALADSRLKTAVKFALAILEGELHSSPGATIAVAILRAVGKIGS